MGSPVQKRLVSGFWEEMNRRHLRRNFLSRNMRPCPACGDDQIQLIDDLVEPAEWKCRMCKHEFQFEPTEST